MKQLIDRISAQLERLKRQYPEASVRHEADFSLNKGADEADFAELEKELGYALPEDFKELYRIADGEAGQEVVLAGEEWLSVRRIIEEYRIWKQLYEKVCLQRMTACRSVASRRMRASNRIYGGIRNGFR